MTNFSILEKFFTTKGWHPFKYQTEAWQAYLDGKSGLINAPTGAGKTYAAFLGAAFEELNNRNLSNNKLIKLDNSVKVLWITPLRALTNDLVRAIQETCIELNLNWKVEARTGDSTSKVKTRQKTKMPDVLITTPESLHIILATSGYSSFFVNSRLIVVDELHELIGSKRGVLIELALSRIKRITNNLKIWGISATINNLEEAAELLVGKGSKFKIVRADIDKKIDMVTVYPEKIERFSWSGHVGLSQIKQVIEIIDMHKTTLVFTNTRSFNEVWHQKIIELRPDLIGQIAIHNGSIGKEERLLVEENINREKYKAILCTSSLDLGVDFRPVDCIIQIGSPHGVSRFLQRAGRSNHNLNKASKIYFVPTFSLELIEAAALRDSIKEKKVEDKLSFKKPYDVLIQYLLTLASSDGFDKDLIFNEIKSTVAYEKLNSEEWEWIINFICHGGKSLQNYEQYSKVINNNGIYKMENKVLLRRHKLSIGTISEDSSLKVKMLSRKDLGTIEENFISSLKPEQAFWFSGKKLKVINIQAMTVYVKISNANEGVFPSWEGGRMDLSNKFSETMMKLLNNYALNNNIYEEFSKLIPLLNLQAQISIIPFSNQLLIEELNSKEGNHFYFYFFKGRNVHEGLASLIAYRISKLFPITFSIAMNDYGFELLTDRPANIKEIIKNNIFDPNNLKSDIAKSVNAAEMAKRKFRTIAKIAGLVFKGFPGEKIAYKNLQLSSELLFDVFKEYDSDNLLLKQAFDEVLQFQLKEKEIQSILLELQKKEIIIKKIERPTPFCFPIMVDRLRGGLTSEKLAERLSKMRIQYDK